MAEADVGDVKVDEADPEIEPSQTLYINNLNERTCKDGESCTLLLESNCSVGIVKAVRRAKPC